MKKLPPSTSQANSNQSTPSIQPTSTMRCVQMIDHEDDANAQGVEVQYTDTHSPTSHMLQVAKSKRDSIDSADQLSTMLPADICRVLSKSSAKPTSTSVNMSKYVVSRSSTSIQKALVDHGSNGGLAGYDPRIIATTDHKVSVCGIGNHELTDLPIVS